MLIFCGLRALQNPEFLFHFVEFIMSMSSESSMKRTRESKFRARLGHYATLKDTSDTIIASSSLRSDGVRVLRDPLVGPSSPSGAVLTTDNDEIQSLTF